jgi:hypothetical protein
MQHGCGIRLHERIPPGTRLLIDLIDTTERSAKGTVIDAVPLDSSRKDWLIGIELETSRNFWGLSDLPVDWSSPKEGPPRKF